MFALEELRCPILRACFALYSQMAEMCGAVLHHLKAIQCRIVV